MIKNLISTVLFLGITLSVSAQNALSIKVLDNETKKSLQGASIVLTKNQSKNLTTDRNGTSKFSGLPDGQYAITISYIGYSTEKKQIDLVQNTDLEIFLKPRAIKTEEVLVMATRAKNNSSTTYKNISKQDIAKNNFGQDIPYLLDQTPSVVIGSDAGAGIGYTNMKIRGSDNARINVTLNGIPLNDAESMGSFFVNLPDFASSTESIQIQRGIGTSTNGAGSFGASLNIQSNTLEKEPYVEFNNSFGSYNSWKNTLKVGSGLLNNKFAFNVRLSRILSDGYIDRASSDLKSFYVDGGYYSDKHILKAIVFSGKEKTYQSWYGTPEPRLNNDVAGMKDYAVNDGYTQLETENLLNSGRTYNKYLYKNQTDNYTQTHHQLHYTNFINEKLIFNAALHYTRGAGYYEEFRPEDDFSKYNLPPVISGTDTIKQTDLVRRRWLDNYFYGTTFSFNYNPSQTIKLTWGGAANQYKGDHYGEIIWAKYASASNLGDKYYLNDAKKDDISTFLKADFTFEKWLLFADIQYRNINYQVKGDDDKIKGMDFKRKFNFVNPKLGITYLINENSNLYASYAYASKEPVRNDFVDLKGNNPKPEKMQDIEAGYRFNNETFNIGTNFYGMFYKDQLIPTGALNNVGSPLRMNIPNSYRIGLEVDAAWKISAYFGWKATAGLSQNKIKNYTDETSGEFIKKTDIALSPATILSSEFTYRPLRSVEIALLSKYISRQYLDNSSAKVRSIDPSFVNNIRAIYNFSILGLKNIDLGLTVNNILNEKYQTNGYTWGYMDGTSRKYFNFYYPQATTNFMLSLNVKF
ncbi:MULTISPECIES: TonB-dependent receptor [Sphingobacterium]|uniref:TonB-dependent receptor n=1 Tax=Sphingobacterium TaxID=28453 RepID=UPI0010514DEC|nr:MULTISPECIES: TonB-dependent receptor [Sphingobacterium]MCW2261575.1 iron complex outermembrane receptor protein [Sphingobacterium kitahiroshimense]NJI75318.1 TonB-dependent receptor [Sphingobacterium sp. B16(2022)]TCR09886.1 iron complex outermembrane receptor protein [Sphingobacterium sp. JUb78]